MVGFSPGPITSGEQLLRPDTALTYTANPYAYLYDFMFILLGKSGALPIALTLVIFITVAFLHDVTLPLQ
jgi:hypothetical protein